jgi:DNA-binding response OmpR family regulator
MSGPDLASAARHLRPDLPIVLATGFLDDISRAAVATLGIDLVLSKPYTLRDLGTALRSVLETRDRPLSGDAERSATDRPASK